MRKTDHESNLTINATFKVNRKNQWKKVYNTVFRQHI